MKVLVTGFDPFGGEKINPAYEAVRLLPDEIAGARIVKAEIPTVFRKCAEKLRETIIKEDPDLILCVGQAGGRADISVERLAVNLEDTLVPDNEGNRPEDVTIVEDGDDAYFVTVPVKEMAANIQRHGIPAHVSYSAGTYVCNDVLYRLLDLLKKEFPGKRGGFIHVPFDVGQAAAKPAGTPSMPVETVSRGIGYAIEAAVGITG